MSIYKRYSDKTKSMYSMIKDEKFLDKCMTIWENVPNIIKNFIVNLYIIKISKSWKKIQHKRKLSMFYIPGILFDWVYRKYENYYPKVVLEKFIPNFFLEKYKKFFVCGDWEVPPEI